MAGAGDDAVLNEARCFIENRINELKSETQVSTIYDIVGITMSVVNELVGLYKESVEESFGFVLGGLEDLNSGSAKLYTIFGAGFSEVPWVCLGSGSSYARPLVELLLVREDLSTDQAARIMPTIFTLVSNVQTTVGGGVDICIVTDRAGAGEKQHFRDVDLNPLRASILHELGI